MPIIHLRDPSETIALSPSYLDRHEELVVALRDLGAKAVMCEPSSRIEVTPQIFRKEHVLPRRDSLWLHMDEQGEVGALIFRSNRKNALPSFIGIDKSDDKTMITVGEGHGQLIGADYTPFAAIAGERGRDFTLRAIVGGALLHRTYEEAVVLMQSFGQTPPPPPPSTV